MFSARKQQFFLVWPYKRNTTKQKNNFVLQMEDLDKLSIIHISGTKGKVLYTFTLWVLNVTHGSPLGTQPWILVCSEVKLGLPNDKIIKN